MHEPDRQEKKWGVESFNLLGSLVLAVVLGFLYIPAQIYGPNHRFFSLSWLNYLGVLIPLAIAFLAALAAPFLFLPDRWRKLYAAIWFGLAIAVWINAFAFTGGVGLLDGKSFRLDFTAAESAANGIVFLGVFMVGALVFWYRSALLNRLAWALAIAFTGVVAWTAFEYPRSLSLGNTDSLFLFSKTKNVLVLLLDTFQSDIFSEIVEASPELKASFDGFTYFPNTVGSARTTYLALPTIHSGLVYHEDMPLRDFFRKALGESSFVSKLHAAGYESDYLTLSLADEMVPHDATINTTVSALYSAGKEVRIGAFYLLGMALFRSAPHALKQSTYDGTHFITELDIGRSYVVNGDLFLQKLSEEAHVTDKARMLKFVHLMDTHPPAELDASCIERAAPWNRANAKAQYTCALKRVAQLLQSLKRLNVYDQTSIVILGDHGAGLPKPGGSPIMAAALPLLLVKPFSSRAPIRSEPRMVGLRDVAATVCGLTKDCEAEQGVDIIDSQAAEAFYEFVYYEWQNDDWYEGKTPDLQRWRITGSPVNELNWVLKEASGLLPVERLDFSASDDQAHFGFGWDAIESVGSSSWRWASSKRAALFFRFEQRKKFMLTMDVATHDGNSDQLMKVFVDGVLACERAISNERQKLRCEIEPSGAFPMPTKIAFEFTQANRAGNGDPRLLAVAFHYLTLAPLDKSADKDDKKPGATKGHVLPIAD